MKLTFDLPPKFDEALSGLVGRHTVDLEVNTMSTAPAEPETPSEQPDTQSATNQSEPRPSAQIIPKAGTGVPVIEGEEYGCSREVMTRAYAVQFASKRLADVAASGGDVGRSVTIDGTDFAIKRLNVQSDSAQDALSSALKEPKHDHPTICLLPPSEQPYVYNDEFELAADTYLGGYGAAIMPAGIRNTRININQARSGIFGARFDAHPEAMSKWVERFENDPSHEGRKDGTVAQGDSGSAHCWFQFAGSHDCMLVDVATTGSLAGVIRSYSAYNCFAENVTGYRTHSDGFHIVHGSHNWTLRRVGGEDIGDDIISFIQYKEGNDPNRHPHHMLVDECWGKGGRGRGFTVVSGQHIYYRRCHLSDITLAAFLFGPKADFSTVDVVDVKVRDSQMWRCGRMTSNNPNSASGFALFAQKDLACLGIDIRNTWAFSYESDHYPDAFIRETDHHQSGDGIKVTTHNSGIKKIDRNA